MGEKREWAGEGGGDYYSRTVFEENRMCFIFILF